MAVDPLYACGTITSNLTDAVAIIIKNTTSEDCHVAKQVSNVCVILYIDNRLRS